MTLNMSGGAKSWIERSQLTLGPCSRWEFVLAELSSQLAISALVVVRDFLATYQLQLLDGPNVVRPRIYYSASIPPSSSRLELLPRAKAFLRLLHEDLQSPPRLLVRQHEQHLPYNPSTR